MKKEKKKKGYARGASLGVAAANDVAALPLRASRWAGATPGMLPRACALVCRLNGREARAERYGVAVIRPYICALAGLSSF